MIITIGNCTDVFMCADLPGWISKLLVFTRGSGCNYKVCKQDAGIG